MKKYLNYIITFGIGLMVSLTIMLSKNVFKQASTSEVMHILCDSFFVPGVVLLGFGLLVVASNGGTFDMLIYGTKKFFNMFRKNPTKRLQETFYDYRTAKSENKMSFLHLIVVGLVFIAISIIFLLLWYEV